MCISSRTVLVPLALAFTACTSKHGNVGAPLPPPLDDGTSSGLLGGGTPQPGVFAPKPTPLRRLTKAQYLASVTDLFDASITLPDDLETDTEVDGFVSLGATRTSPSAHGTDQYVTAAYALAHEVLADVGTRDAFVGCAPSSSSDDACARSFASRFGRRVFRRPLTADEIDRYTSLFTDAAPVAGDFYASLEYVVAAMLQSPYFLYRSEIGRPDPVDSTRRILDPYELASRLSYLFWNTMPDDSLLDAAASGEIGTDEGLARHVERLLKAPRALDASEQFFSELFQLGRLDTLPQLPSSYPQMSPTFGAAARQEMLTLVQDIVWHGADYHELFNTRKGFLNAEMASLYGVGASSDATPVELPPERAGMFARAAFLAMNGHASSTSPTKRGKYVREVVFCEVVAPPPPNANVALTVDAPSPVPRTLREDLASHVVNPVCRTCHTLLDPIGLGVEEFDGIGAFRTVEVGRPIDNSGRFEVTPFAGAAALGALVAKDAWLGPCLVRKLFRYAVGHLESEGEQPVLDALSKNFEAHGRSVQELFRIGALSASFRYTGEPE